MFAIPNYILYRLDRTCTSRSGAFIHGGGLACYVKNSIVSTDLEIYFSTIDLELMVIGVRLSDQRTHFVCIAYRPPSGNYSVALNKLMDVVIILRKNMCRHSIIIGSDLNIDLSKAKTSSPVRTFDGFCRELALDSLIDLPTRFSLTGSSNIDVFMSDSAIVSSHGVINYNISDHLAIYLVLKKSKTVYKSTTFTGRS